MPAQYDLVALMPLKGNSERVKGKNFRKFAGKPLFWWTLEHLLEMPEVDLVVINTDARHILAEHGLRESPRLLIRDRKPEICGDKVSMNLVLADDLAAVDAKTYLMTHTTNPLLSSETMRRGYQTYLEGLPEGKDSLFAVNRFQTRFYRADGSPVNHDPQNLVRTQDLEPWYEENSNLYFFSRESFARTNARIGTQPILFETPVLESQDIDDKVGWRTAEILALAGMLAESHLEE